MRHLAAALILLTSIVGAQAQEGVAEQAVWHTDFPQAVAAATTAGKPLLLDFTGSDWCGGCIALHDEVFATPAFAAWAKDRVVLVEVDFPHAKPQSEAVKRQNEDLSRRFAIEGYPTILFLDPTGTRILGQLTYQEGGPGPWTAAASAILAKGAAK